MYGDVTPLMYAFVRMDLVVDTLGSCERRLAEYARGEGFELATVFHERGDGSAFEALCNELVRTHVRHVIVPSDQHLCGLPVPRNALLARLYKIDAWAWEIPAADHSDTIASTARLIPSDTQRQQ